MSISLTSEQAAILNRIESTNDHIFVTGRAGTGKSTLLQEFVRHTKKPLVVAAPTGVAALNVGGQTIHSLFRLPIGLITEQTKFYPPSEDARTLLKRVQTIVIDEISMVRADLLDGLDRRMRMVRGNRHEPFGGAQVIMFGDPYQLSPVISDPAEKQYIADHYASEWFFDSKVWAEAAPTVVELSDVLRQDEPEFRDILDRMRNGTMHADDAARINSIGARRPVPEDTITLAITNNIVTSLNGSALTGLTGTTKTANARVEGDFGKQTPADENLELKPGARVMFLRNDSDGRWVNGTLGTVIKIDDAVHVATDDAPHAAHKVEPVLWEKIQYTYDPEERKVEQTVIATFEQFPVRLAWAVTIHKSQGKTLDSALIDLGNGAFADGQTYVAFSRIKTLDGVYLSRPLRPSDVRVDRRVVEFMRNASNYAQPEQLSFS